MTRPLCAACALAFACSLLSFTPAWSQTGSGLKIEPYTGPPVYLDETTETVPASVVESKVQKQNYENGKLWIERGLTRYSDNSFVSNGVYREFYRDGQQFVEGQFVDNEPTGEWTYWRPNGQLAKKVTFKEGNPDGVVEVFRADGSLEAKKQYSMGKRDGVWETFAEDGQTRLTESAFDNGKPTGSWKWWYESGKPMREATFEDGKMEGLATEWAEDGSKRAEVNFRDGKKHGLAKQWTADGREIEQQYEDGKPVSKTN